MFFIHVTLTRTGEMVEEYRDFPTLGDAWAFMEEIEHKLNSDRYTITVYRS